MDAQTFRTDRIATALGTWEVLQGGAGPRLLFLHGEEGQRGWLAHHQRLAERFTVLAPTMPGVGGSARPAWAESVPALAKCYLALLDHLQWDTCILAGASLGGWIAAELATLQPARFGALVLAGAQGLPTGAYDVPDMFLTPYRRYISFGYAEPEGAAYTAAWPEAPPDEAADHDVEMMELAALVGFKPYMHDRALAGALKRFTNPTLLAWGDQDRLTPQPVANAYQAALPQAQLTIIPHAGHYVHFDQPVAFTGAVARFMETNAP
jgi:pimeloyl-ACP methyl ester carboxylesterase